MLSQLRTPDGSVGFGEDKPLRPNDSPQNRRKNRRVELHIAKSP